MWFENGNGNCAYFALEDKKESSIKTFNVYIRDDCFMFGIQDKVKESMKERPTANPTNEEQLFC